MKLDALIFAAHPDDVELSIGGTVAKLTDKGLKVGVIDMTQGEMGTRGSVETRYKEADEASKILKLTLRDNLKLPDGKIRMNDEFVRKIVEQIRKYKPNIIMAPYFVDRHPDHEGAGKIVKEAFFTSGLQKYESELDGEKQDFYRPQKLYYYMQTYEFKPSFIVDISDYFETKMAAIRAYGSQFYDPNSNEPETLISSKNFIEYLAARSKVFGLRIRKDYGEPFICEEDIELDLVHHLEGMK